jgi:two-component system phosphate regulon response regulator OmpR
LGGSAEAPDHILVVDDDARIRDLLKRFLSRNGYLVTVARDAAHASRLLDSLAFDMLVVDVMMPGEDGFSLTRRIRARRIRAEIDAPILLLTARGETGDRIEGLEAGADDYLAKPFEPRELLLRIAAILRRAAPPPVADAPPRTLMLGEAHFDILRGELKRGDEVVRLTSTEQALMRVFSRQPNEPVSRTRLAEELGGTAHPAAAQDRGRPEGAALPANGAWVGVYADAGLIGEALSTCGRSLRY